MNFPRRGLLVYGAALLGVGVATSVRYVLDPMLGEHVMYSMYFLAVSMAAWAGGVRPAMITAGLSCLLANYLFSNPRGHLQIDSIEQLCGLIIFLSVSLLIGVLCEVSLQRLARAQAAEQQKDDFLAILAHELRNPLAIIHYTNAAEQSGTFPIDLEHTTVIDEQVQRLDHMIEDLLDLSRVSRGKFRLEFEPIDVAAVVDEVLQKTCVITDELDQELVTHRADDGLILWADRMRLQQILSNLLRNAAQSTPRGGQIELTTLKEKNAAVFRIRDNGHGIAKELLSSVFDLQTHVERSLATSGKALSLGLPLVRTLVELHGGNVAVISDGPERGSEFIVRIPLHAAPAGASATAAAPHRPR